MARLYAERDHEVVDYGLIELGPNVWEYFPHIRKFKEDFPFLIRGPKPKNLEKDQFFSCIGAAQTFGRFCQKPFPTLLSEVLSFPVLNLGRGGAGAGFFLTAHPQLLEYVNRSKFVIVQVMSGRSVENSLFENCAGKVTRRSDRKRLWAHDAYQEAIDREGVEKMKEVIEETRENWIQDYKNLLARIKVPKILLWFSKRLPEYKTDFSNAARLFSGFPQLVNRRMVEAIRKDADDYVEAVTCRGNPHLLTSRFTGKPVKVLDYLGRPMMKDNYYSSPEMHEDAFEVLFPYARKFYSL